MRVNITFFVHLPKKAMLRLTLKRITVLDALTSGRIHGLCTTMIRMRHKVNYRRLAYLLLACFSLGMLSGCKSDSSAVEFPPTEEAVQTAAEELHWTLDSEKTESWAEDHILYTLETEDQGTASVSCALMENNRLFTENCVYTQLTDKPQFAWEDWKDAVTLAETLYGGFSEGELYQALSEQDIPEPEISEAGPDTPTGAESLSWEVELPAGYGTVKWFISAGLAEKTFPSPVIQEWQMIFSLSLYESKEANESMVEVS